MKYRTESDVLGKVRVPEEAYYGSETQRTVNNFQISGLKIDWRFIESLVLIKKAAALANMSTGKLDRRRGSAIVKACNEILSGKLSEHFVTDVFQAGAGTSTNMNANEVIANRAITILKGKKGDYKVVHPNDHVNMSQSTNDIFHSAIHISCYRVIGETLLPELKNLSNALNRKAKQFSKIIKVGRTHLQDAVPITLGQEFRGYAGAISKTIDNLRYAQHALLELPLGGTAVGTGINADKTYARNALKQINMMTGCRFFISDNKFKVQQSQQDELMVSNALKEIAIATGKIANDLRLMTSGPRGGIGEIILPELLPGSSIMPGKINPSVPEMLGMVGFEVIGLSHTIDISAASGQLELNVFMPIVAYNLLFSINILSNAIHAFTESCITGIRAKKGTIAWHLNMDLSIATALTPYIGYAKASKIAREAYLGRKSIMEVCIEKKILDRRTLQRVLDPKNAV
ncbi:MAG TPA: aspartate ammonia-lyase [Candidatus Acidoferrum sp.]|nr:aspartate ammonia-lyase [Candidatus Acidoferrum sp.]